jgi:hypothetical protein
VNNWLDFILLTFVCYRLAQLFALDEGPFSVFHKLRVVTGAYDYDDSGRAKTGLGRAMTCPYCLGIWIALLLSLHAIGIHWSILVWWLAIAGGQAFLQGISK